MGVVYWVELAATSLAVVLVANWIFKAIFLLFKRDLAPAALEQQSQISTVRKEKETAYYRNFLVPNGFPLTTGLGLALGYRIRNGNFADVWSAIMALAGENSVEFTSPANVQFHLNDINGMAVHFLIKHLATQNYKHVGIAVPCSTLPGFVSSIAAMMASVKCDVIPHFLASVPRQRLPNVDILIIGSWKAFKQLNGSEKWYKMIVVCEDASKEQVPLPSNLETQVITWTNLIEGYNKVDTFEYTCPEDMADDKKMLLQVTSPFNETTSFKQVSLVSSIAAFVRGFPLGHELNKKDHLTIVDPLASASSSIQIWDKTLGVLLLGGSLSFTSKYSLRNSRATLLVIQANNLVQALRDETSFTNKSPIQKMKLSWVTTLLSEGVFTKIAQFPVPEIEKLRCVYIAEQIADPALASSFTANVPKLKPNQSFTSKLSLTTAQLNTIRATLGARVILEMYCPFIVFGPVAQTNIYDYRVLPPSVDARFACHGVMTTTLEGKFVETEANKELDISKRQGLLCIRGFTIGKPVEDERLKNALKLCDQFGGGEGWMPIVGLFGLWGQDGCMYIYK